MLDDIPEKPEKSRGVKVALSPWPPVKFDALSGEVCDTASLDIHVRRMGWRPIFLACKHTLIEATEDS